MVQHIRYYHNNVKSVKSRSCSGYHLVKKRRDNINVYQRYPKRDLKGFLELSRYDIIVKNLLIKKIHVHR